MSYSAGRFCVAVMTLVVVYAPTARALELDWQAPVGCPNADAVKRDVQRLAGANEGITLIARAAVTQIPDQKWRVAIDLAGSATGHRTLTAESCAQLARASALIIALAANPEAALDLPSDEPPPALPLDESKAKQPKTQPEPTVDTAPSKGQAPLAVDLFTRVGFEHGSLPAATGWIGFGARLRQNSLPIAFAFLTYVTQETSATYTNGVGANFRVFAAQALACFQPKTHRWFFAGCGGTQLSATRAQGYLRSDNQVGPRFDQAEIFVRYRWVVAPMLSLGVGYEFLPRVAAELGGGIAVPPTRWRFNVENLGQLFRPEPKQLLLYAGLGLRF